VNGNVNLVDVGWYYAQAGFDGVPVSSTVNSNEKGKHKKKEMSSS
jgi:hypothetical protein